jgi:hypothetical protein
MAKYGPKAQEKVGKAMHEMKEGKLKSGRSGKKVTSQKQAVAIGHGSANLMHTATGLKSYGCQPEVGYGII